MPLGVRLLFCGSSRCHAFRLRTTSSSQRESESASHNPHLEVTPQVHYWLDRLWVSVHTKRVTNLGHLSLSALVKQLTSPLGLWLHPLKGIRTLPCLVRFLLQEKHPVCVRLHKRGPIESQTIFGNVNRSTLHFLAGKMESWQAASHITSCIKKD